MTGPDLEQQFFDCASLFLARLTAWIRIRLSPNATAVRDSKMKYNSRHHIPSENDSRHHIGVFNRIQSLKDDRSYSWPAKLLKNIQESDWRL